MSIAEWAKNRDEHNAFELRISALEAAGRVKDDQIAALNDRVAQLESKRGPGRPKESQ